MFNGIISKVVELIKGPQAALAREFPGTERFQELAKKLGKNFPHWNYDRVHWPLPYYQMVSREEALNHCPDCGSFQQLGPRDRFPETYICGCGFNGPHPLYATNA